VRVAGRSRIIDQGAFEVPPSPVSCEALEAECEPLWLPNTASASLPSTPPVDVVVAAVAAEEVTAPLVPIEDSLVIWDVPLACDVPPSVSILVDPEQPATRSRSKGVRESMVAPVAPRRDRDDRTSDSDPDKLNEVANNVPPTAILCGRTTRWQGPVRK